MKSLARFFSASGRIRPKPFAVAAAAVYLVSFLSQFLLAAPVTARASVIPFLLVQILAGSAWTALHLKRLRDAGRPGGAAVALAILYALAIVLLLLMMAMANAPAITDDETPAGWSQTLLLFFLISVILSDPNLGMFGIIALIVLALIMLPMVIAVVFTIWTATRPGAAAMP
jgi:uncharacterized membrane protein YhaH (DUF805 family)